MRPEWHIGVIDRINNQHLHPLGGLAWEIHNKLYFDMMAPHFGTITSMLTEATMRSKFRYSLFSQKDKEVLDDSDKLHHKYTTDEINPLVVDLSVLKIQFDLFEHLVFKYYKGRVL